MWGTLFVCATMKRKKYHFWGEGGGDLEKKMLSQGEGGGGGGGGGLVGGVEIPEKLCTTMLLIDGKAIVTK